MAAALLAASLAAGADGPAPRPGEADFRAMVVALQAMDLDVATARGEAAVAADPGNAEYLDVLGRVYGRQAQHSSLFTRLSWASKCRAAWLKARDLDPRNVAVRMDLVRYYIYAPGILGGSAEKALAEADAIAALSPMEGFIARGIIAEHAKELAKAEEWFRKAVAADANGNDGIGVLSGFLAHQKRFGEARALWEKRLADVPADTVADYQLARLALRSGEGLEGALAHLDRFLASPPPPRGPGWADARWCRGLVLERLGRIPDAIGEYRKAVQLVPGHRAEKELKRLKTPA